MFEVGYLQLINFYGEKEMRERIMSFQKVQGRVGETFQWGLGIYQILHVTKDYWIILNELNGRELRVR